MSINPPKFDLNQSPQHRSVNEYQQLVGEQAWSRLHPDIQQRFGACVHQKVTYQGKMSKVYASLAGKVFAQVCRLIGTPLAIATGEDVPMTVKVYPNRKLNGMTWDRFYAFPNKSVNRVKSTKVIQKGVAGKPIGLVEMVGYGFGMKLEVSVVNGALQFASSEFFWQVANRKFHIPDWLSPGKTVVQQKALNDGQFEFRLEVTHAILGKVFEQIGVFKGVG